MRLMSASEISKAVSTLYRKGGYVVLSEVRNGTGYAKSARTLDMMAVSTWPSRGLFIEGIEIKRDRNDLRRELANPQKADDLAKYCKLFWIAIPDDLLTADMPIPEAWGIIAVDEKSRASVQRRGKELTPEPMDALLVCSLIRKFAESHVPIDEVQPKINAAREDERKSSDSSRSIRHKDLEKAVAEFKESSGVDLLDKFGHPVWDLGNIAAAVKLITDLHGRPDVELGRAMVALDTAKKAIEAAGQVMFPREFDTDRCGI